MGQFCVRLPLGAGLRSSELPDYGARAEGEETAGQGEKNFCFVHPFIPFFLTADLASILTGLCL